MSPRSVTQSADWRVHSKLAWVSQYTADAVFDGGGEHATVGRESLLAMARSMSPLRSVSIRPLRTEGQRGPRGCLVSGVMGQRLGREPAATVDVRGVLVWRKEPDGVWRVSMEHIG